MLGTLLFVDKECYSLLLIIFQDSEDIVKAYEIIPHKPEINVYVPNLEDGESPYFIQDTSEVIHYFKL